MKRKPCTALTTPAPASLTPAQLLTIAVEKGAEIDKLSQLMELQVKWEANEARKAFNAALAAFKAEPLKISKNKQVSFDTGRGTTRYKHATLDNVCDVAGPALQKHGLSHHWDVQQVEARIIVSCILTHVMGHSERVTMEAVADDSGSKNKIQQVGSTVTYLQRYTLLAITGLAAANADDDGAAAGKGGDGKLANGKLADHMAAIDAAADKSSLQQAFGSAFNAAKAVRDAGAMLQLTEAKDARLKELGK